MNPAIDTFVNTFTQQFGDQIAAIYLFGSMATGHHLAQESDINLYLVMNDHAPMEAMRQAFQPIWAQYGNLFGRAPFVATRQAFIRDLRLNALFAKHLMRDARLLYGTSNLITEKMTVIEPHEAYAHRVSEAMAASAALAPHVLMPEAREEALHILHKTARQIRNQPLPPDETAVQTFARIQSYLEPILDVLPATQKWKKLARQGSTTLIIPGLQAIYSETGKAILVFQQLPPQLLFNTDWNKLATRIPQSANGLQITTVEQLCLVIMYDRPLDLRFRKFQHVWGPNFLTALKPSDQQIIRHSARVPSRILINELPNAYLTSPGDDESLHKIIHDFQNKMLNVQLEHELLCRFGIVERFIPPQPVPDRETPPKERIARLFQHLEWWSEFYANHL